MQCQKNTQFCSIICANFWVKNIWANFCEIICENFWLQKNFSKFFHKHLRKFLGEKIIVQIFVQLFAKYFWSKNFGANIFANICAIFWKTIFVQIFAEKFAKKISANFLWILPHRGRAARTLLWLVMGIDKILQMITKLSHSGFVIRGPYKTYDHLLFQFGQPQQKIDLNHTRYSKYISKSKNTKQN